MPKGNSDERATGSAGRAGLTKSEQAAEQRREYAESRMEDIYETSAQAYGGYDMDVLRDIERNLIQIQRMGQMNDDDRRLLSRVRILMGDEREIRRREAQMRRLSRRTRRFAEEMDLPV